MSVEGSPLLAQAETPATEAKTEAQTDAAAPPAAEAKVEVKTDAGAEAKEPAKQPADAKAAPAPEPEMNVVVVSDIDMLYSAFFALRARGEDPDSEVNLAVDNVAFVLNALDVLAGDDRFVDLRKRRPVHRTLTKLENWTAASREKAIEAREEYMNKFEDGKATAQKELDSQVAKIADRTDLDPLQKRQMMETVRINQEKQLETKTEQLKKERDDMVYKSETDLAVEISRVQNQVKWWAVALPALAPLALGLGVFLNRRAGEREGVAKSRLR
jgi:ABC-2 type transport system permease protein